jgi:hypothetical protein
MNKVAAVALAMMLVLALMLACSHTPSMKMGPFNRTPADLVDPEYRNGNEYDDRLITSTEEVLKENKEYGSKTYAFLIRGQRPQSYKSKEEYKKIHPHDLVIEYSNGRKLAIFTNFLPTPDMKDWDICWDANPPNLPQRIR